MATENAVDILEGLYKLWTEERHLDFTVCNKTKSVKCHKVLLALFSDRVRAECTESDDAEDIIRVSDDPEYLISKLYKWENVSYVDYLNNLVLRAHDLQISFLLQGDSRRELNFNSDTFIEKLRQDGILQFSHRLAKFWKSEILTDVVLKVENARYKCHKAILAAASSFFDAMFMSGMREADDNEVHLQGLDKLIMKKILSFIYTGENIIDVINADELFSASVFLQIPVLQNRIEHFLVRHMDCENSIDILRIGKLCNCEKLQIEAKTFILRNYSEILKQCQNNFFEITAEEMSELISNDDLSIFSEEDLLDSVLLWFENQKENHESTFLSILKCVRLSHIKHETLKKKLETSKYLSQYSSCKTYVLSVIDSDGEESKTKEPQRNEEVLLVVQTSSYKKGIQIACFSFPKQIWYHLPSLSSYDPGSSSGVCCGGKKIYLTGGSGSPRGFLQYCGISNSWDNLEQMKMGRSAHCTCIVGDHLFVLGGCTTTSASFSAVEKYDFLNRTWHNAGTLLVAVANAACSVVKDKIIIFGGTKSFGEYTRDIQYFDTKTESSSIVAKFPPKIMSGFIGVAVDFPSHYLVTADGKVLLYEEGDSPEIIGSIHNQRVMGFATFFCKGTVMVLGGSSPNFESNSVKQFNIASRKSTVAKNLKLPFAPSSNQYFAAMFNINKQYLTQNVT